MSQQKHEWVAKYKLINRLGAIIETFKTDDAARDSIKHSMQFGLLYYHDRDKFTVYAPNQIQEVTVERRKIEVEDY